MCRRNTLAAFPVIALLCFLLLRGAVCFAANPDYSRFSRLCQAQLILTEQAAVRDLKLSLPDIEFHFARGVILRLAPVEGRVTGFSFFGQGWAVFTPSDSGEARELDRRTEEHTGSERRDFKQLYCRFSDWNGLSFSRVPAFVPLLHGKSQSQALRDPDRWLARQLAKCQDGARLSLRNPYVEILEDFKTNRRPGCFYAVYTPGEPGADQDRFYRFEPRDDETIAYNGWCRYNLPDNRVDSVSGANNPPVPVWFDIDATIDSTGHIEFRVEGRYVVTASNLTHIFLNLAPIFDLRGVTNQQGQKLEFWAEHGTEALQGLAVFLGREHVRGDTIVLRFDYQGDPAVARGGGFFLPQELQWYPSVPSISGITVDARFDFPSTMSLVASGRKIKEVKNPHTTRSYWVLSNGPADFSFAFGNFGTRDYFYEGIPPVTICSPRLRGEPKAADSLKDAASDVLNSLGYFRKIFGPFSFQNLTVVETPSESSGVSAGLLLLPCRSMGAGVGQTSEISCGHEIAHQWWGTVLAGKTYRDQWLIEGMAQYSSALYLEKARKRTDLFLQVLREWRDDILAEESAAGPLCLGRRLPERVLHAKGASVMHMLRMMMTDLDIGSDRRFLAMIRDFLEYYRGREVTTQEFQHQVELYYGDSMGWFFDQWVYGTEIPAYVARHRIEQQRDGRYLVRLEVEQRGVGNTFRMPVPITVSFRHHRPHRQRVWISGPLTVVNLGPFDSRPVTVTFNDYDGVLARPTGATERIVDTDDTR